MEKMEFGCEKVIKIAPRSEFDGYFLISTEDDKFIKCVINVKTLKIQNEIFNSSVNNHFLACNKEEMIVQTTENQIPMCIC